MDAELSPTDLELGGLTQARVFPTTGKSPATTTNEQPESAFTVRRSRGSHRRTAAVQPKREFVLFMPALIPKLKHEVDNQAKQKEGLQFVSFFCILSAALVMFFDVGQAFEHHEAMRRVVSAPTFMSGGAVAAQRLDDITTTEGVLDYTFTLVNSLFVGSASAHHVTYGELARAQSEPESWYTDDDAVDDGYRAPLDWVAMQNRVIGGILLKQRRALTFNCISSPNLAPFAKRCWSMFDDNRPFGGSAETPADKIYHYSDEFKSYVVWLAGSSDRNSTLSKLDTLRKSSGRDMFLTRRTRSFTISFVTYNSNLNRYCDVQIIFDFSSSGFLAPTVKLQSIAAEARYDFLIS